MGEGSGGPPIHISGCATEKWLVQSENRDDVPDNITYTLVLVLRRRRAGYRLKKDILNHLSEVASDYRRHAEAKLPPTTKRLFLENYQLNGRVTEMYDEIHLLRQQSVEWKAEDARQIGRMRDLRAANTATTSRNITINMVLLRGVDPYGTGGTCHVPPIFGLGGRYHECPPNISRVISATFYPCNVFLIS